MLSDEQTRHVLKTITASIGAKRTLVGESVDDLGVDVHNAIQFLLTQVETDILRDVSELKKE